jgi:K+-transporting ATPase ATPase C chain
MLWKELKTGVFALIALSVLTGVVYPLLVTAMARLAFPREADGSLIVREGKPVGSRLIGQPFSGARYFWSRLSATSPTPYNASASSGSNLGPTNPALRAAAAARIDALRALDPQNLRPVPVDLVTASGSGLDPRISPAAAEYQLARVARSRGLPEARVRELIALHTEPRTLALLGEPAVNVLELNLALDALPGSARSGAP